MTLIEVVVACALFGVLASALIVLLTSMIDVSKDDSRRTVANHLAVRELEIIRDAFSSSSRGPEAVAINKQVNRNPLPGQSAGQPLVVDGIPYTVTSDVSPQPMDKPFKSPCDQDNGEFDYYVARVEVTWEGMEGRSPVVMDTLMTPPKGTFPDGRGHIGVKVIDADGKPSVGVTVTATAISGGGGSGGGTDTTAIDGCAFLPDIPPGSYSVKASASGFVNQQGVTDPTLTATVVSGQLWKGSLFYDRAAAMTVNICPPSTEYPLPTNLNSTPVSLGHPSLLPSGAKAFTSTGTRAMRNCAVPTVREDGTVTTPPASNRTAEVRNLTGLWPYPAGYEAWAGGCGTNDPAWPGFTDSARDLPVAVKRGDTSSTVVTLDPVAVTLGSNLRAVEAVPMDDVAMSCTAGRVITLGTPPGVNSALKSSLPAGVWQIRRTGTTVTKTITVTKGGPVQAVTLP
uniref:carboxypeptidase regulatory-like domain-containing protein n=1 Tax=Nocardioides sp. GXZ039 TaxID=3136018 RepID=UPI0030F43C8E